MKRRKFILISGLQKQASRNLDERKYYEAECVKGLLEELHTKDCSPEEITRNGRINTSKLRLFRVKCEVMEDKIKIQNFDRRVNLETPQISKTYLSILT